VISITVGAVPAGYRFLNWTSDGGGTFANPNSAATTFTMPSNNVTVTANFEATYTVTVSGGTGGGVYAIGTTVSIAAVAAPAGTVFTNWTTASDGVRFANANNAATTFTMPANAVTVTANFISGFIDARDGNVYRTVTIGGKNWMAENLNYQPQSGNYWCYGNSAERCAQYGKLYDWATAKTVCPSRWHLPSRQEWGDLAEAAGGTGPYGGRGAAGKALKSASGWNVSGNGTDSYGFSALPGGNREDGEFYSVGYYGGWWTATESGRNDAYLREIDYNQDYIYDYDYYKSTGQSVRCVED
jgi:uncharacterized protein (TIGR02145 family)